MLEVNLATGNLLCAISTGRFYDEGLPPYHEVALVHNAQRASTSGDFTGGFDLGDGWSSNLGVILSFPSSGAAELVLGDGNVIEFEDQSGTWAPEAGSFLTLEAEGSAWVVTDKAGWKTHLDSSGKLTSIESSEGNSYAATWGTNGVSSAVEPSGRGSTFDYDTSGRLETVDFPTGTLWTLAYDTNGLLASVTNADYGTVSMTYDGSGRIETFTDYDDFTWEFEYWGSTWPDRLKTITFPDQTEASLAYMGLINRVITTVTDQRGELWKSVHDVEDSPDLMATSGPMTTTPRAT
jgi:YD repeat-containing protein